ncbi:hypothetical protein [Staphylococcus aureus]|uniref:hypothetical protein n=1 Tax=Staphylococcus aureus TaxID=1280 RepID=UPI000DFC4041|nr:hypothetical protein [Staphylococcus aureus]SUK03258.1 Uncharacterised protein [Staphylococcus aureus]SUK09174.1 Uncharacterised protein [Staphylococcus aureus]SUK11210.1 Uncharacterised protein [Staphylococcus aureus]SUK14463.1 Uncharacterised protein [Staphylococcus aureus]
MKKYERLISFYADDDINKVNDYLEQGWELVHVGTKLVKILDNGQAYYNTEYVLGGTKEQYDKHLADKGFGKY